jgi:hypothetical protein
MDYPVPNFGQDKDVIRTYNSLDLAEKMRGHHWVYTGPAPKPDDPVEYNFEPDLEDDVKISQAHAEQADKQVAEDLAAAKAEENKSNETNASNATEPAKT